MKCKIYDVDLNDRFPDGYTIVTKRDNVASLDDIVLLVCDDGVFKCAFFATVTSVRSCVSPDHIQMRCMPHRDWAYIDGDDDD